MALSSDQVVSLKQSLVIEFNENVVDADPSGPAAEALLGCSAARRRRTTSTGVLVITYVLEPGTTAGDAEAYVVELEDDLARGDFETTLQGGDGQTNLVINDATTASVNIAQAVVFDPHIDPSAPVAQPTAGPTEDTGAESAKSGSDNSAMIAAVATVVAVVVLLVVIGAAVMIRRHRSGKWAQPSDQVRKMSALSMNEHTHDMMDNHLALGRSTSRRVKPL